MMMHKCKLCNTVPSLHGVLTMDLCCGRWDNLASSVRQFLHKNKDSIRLAKGTYIMLKFSQANRL